MSERMEEEVGYRDDFASHNYFLQIKIWTDRFPRRPLFKRNYIFL